MQVSARARVDSELLLLPVLLQVCGVQVLPPLLSARNTRNHANLKLKGLNHIT